MQFLFFLPRAWKKMNPGALPARRKGPASKAFSAATPSASFAQDAVDFQVKSPLARQGMGGFEEEEADPSARDTEDAGKDDFLISITSVELNCPLPGFGVARIRLFRAEFAAFLDRRGCTRQAASTICEGGPRPRNPHRCPVGKAHPERCRMIRR
jgi:hypothetical protein